MPCVYFVKLPAKHDVVEKDIFEILREWINQKNYHFFENIDFSKLESRQTVSTADADLTFVHGVSPKTKANCIGLRMETAMNKRDGQVIQDNLVWQVDFLYHPSDESPYFQVVLCCTVANTDLPADMSGTPRIPSIVGRLIEAEMLEMDAGLPFCREVLPWTEEIRSAVHDIMQKSVPTCVPLMFMPESMVDIGNQLAWQICGMAHVIAHPDCKDVVVMYPWLQKERNFSAMDAALKDRVSEYTMESTRMSMHQNVVIFDEMASWVEKEGDSARTIPEGYLRMNEQMADALKRARLRRGMTQAQLALAADTTSLTVSRLETRRITRVHAPLIATMEQVLGLKVGELMNLDQVDVPGKGKKLVVQEEKSQQGNCEQEVTLRVNEEGMRDSCYCNKCGSKLYPNSIFCHVCGNKIPR